MGKGKFNPKNGNGRPTMNQVLERATEESGVFNVGLVRAGERYNVAGGIDRSYAESLGVKMISGRAHCESVGRGVARFYGLLDDGVIWRADVPLDSMSNGDGVVNLGDSVMPELMNQSENSSAYNIWSKHL